MNPISYWGRMLTHRLRLIPVGFKHWLGDTFSWYRKHKGGVWCRWIGYWAQADSNNFVRFQREPEGYSPTNDTWYWVIDQTHKVGDRVIDATENYDAVDASNAADKRRQAKEERER